MSPDLDSGWKLYTKPLRIEEGDMVYALANRIGYAGSEIVEFKNE